MSFVDAYSKFTWLYLLKSKVKALSTFKQFKSLVELQHGLPIKVVSLFLDLTAHKLDFRSQDCIFLKYPTSHKGYI